MNVLEAIEAMKKGAICKCGEYYYGMQIVQFRGKETLTFDYSHSIETLFRSPVANSMSIGAVHSDGWEIVEEPIE